MNLSKISKYIILSYIFVMPFRGVFAIESSFSFTRLLPVLAILFWILHLMINKNVHPPSKFNICLFFFSAWATVSVLWANSSSSIATSITFLATSIFIYSFWDLMQNKYLILISIKAYTIGCLLTVISEIVYFFIMHPERAGVVTGGPNEFALRVLFAVPMSWYLFQVREDNVNFFWLTIVTLTVIAIVLSQSRQALAGLLLVMIILLMYSLKQKGFQSLYLLPVAAPIPFLGDVIQRVRNLNDGVDSSLETRINIAEAGIDVFLQNPVRGVGIGGFNEAVEPILGRTKPAENAFLSIGAETGIIGLTLFGLLIVSLSEDIFPINDESILSVSLICIWMTGAIFNDWQSGIITYTIFILIILTNKKV